MTVEAGLRRDALACLGAAVAAVEPRSLVRDFLRRHPGVVEGRSGIRLIAVGKAAAAMAHGAIDGLANRVMQGVVIVPAGTEGQAPPGLVVYGGGHPVPNAAGVAGAGAVAELATGAGESELVLCLISGGGSALMTLPPAGIALDEIRETTDLLLRSGADIDELNTVRKHLDLLKGGRLAAAAAPARVLALVLSDVVGDPLDVIASGPTWPDPTTFDDARMVLVRRHVWDELPGSVRRFLQRGAAGEEPETPDSGHACFSTAEAHIVGNNRMAAAAACQAAQQLGYEARVETTTLTGEAREAGDRLARLALEISGQGRPLGPPACLVTAGETTVTVTGAGRGGRNQELALGAALTLDGNPGCLVASMGTDGIDGPTDAAGATADGDTLPRARRQGLDARAALADNDSYPFFAALGELILTGPTGTNVMDLQLVMVAEVDTPATMEDPA